MTEAERAALEQLHSEIRQLRLQVIRQDQQQLELIADMFYRAGMEDARAGPRPAPPPPEPGRRRLWVVKAAGPLVALITAAGPCPWTSPVPLFHPAGMARVHVHCKPRVRRSDHDHDMGLRGWLE